MMEELPEDLARAVRQAATEDKWFYFRSLEVQTQIVATYLE